MAVLQRRNLRDLGGLPTRRPGQAVRRGRFFRSSALSDFGPEESRVLTSLKLRSAIDLRSDAEVAESRVLLASANVQVVRLPLFQAARQNWIAPADQSPQATATRYFEMVQDSLDALGALMVHLARPDAAPFVVSCSAGRDRTGIAVTCFLDLLGVIDEAVARDYAVSDSFSQQTGRAHADTIHQLLELVRSRYGSTQDMLGLRGVTSTVCQTLRQEFLVESP